MNKSFYAVLICAAAVLGSVQAAAQNTAVAGSNSDSTSLSVGVGQGVGVGVVDNSSNNTQFQGQSLSSTNTNSLTNTSSNANSVSNTSSNDLVSTNNSGASVEGVAAASSLDITFEGATYNPSPIIPVAPNIPTPQIFGNMTPPANATGIPLVLSFLKSCNMDIALGDMQSLVGKGHSKRTNVTWTPYPGYRTQETKGGIARVATELPAGEHKYACLGTLTVSAAKGTATSVDLSTVVGDAAQYTLRNLQGAPRVYMISAAQAVAAASAVDSSGRGLGLSSALSGLLSGPGSALMGGVGGGSISNGRTSAEALVGNTLLLVAIDANGMPLNSSELAAYYRPLANQPTSQLNAPAPTVEQQRAASASTAARK